MIIKTKIGRSFGGCVRYNFEQEKKAEILEACGIRTESQGQIINDLNFQRKANPNLGKAVWHTSISFSPNDKVTPELMKNIAKDYANKFKLEQYIVIKHNDAKHEHFHIIANRVNNQGKTISDQYCAGRGVELSKKLEKEYKLEIAEGKKRTIEKPIEKEKKHKKTKKINKNLESKTEIYKSVNNELGKCQSLDVLKEKLKDQGIETQIHKHSNNKAYGISFAKGDFKFKGSQINKNFSIKGLEKTIANTISLIQNPIVMPIKIIKRSIDRGMSI